MTFDPRTLPMGALVAGTDWVKRCILGSGGMGVVLGVEKDPGIRGAMKVMQPELASRPEHVARFLQEARMMVALRHPNIVQVIDAGRFPDGTPFVVTEWLDGRTLRASLAKHSSGLPAVVAWEINRQLCTGLHRAHCHTVKDVPTPIVHRDVKPENIFLQKQELAEPGVKLLDFGVAQLMDGTDDRRSTAGTLAYMAPEQIRGERVTPWTDVYAATLVLYEMLTGRLPWDIDYNDFDQMISAHRSLAPIPPARFAPWIPQGVERLILRGLAKDPSSRPSSAYELATELYELQFVDEARASFRIGVIRNTTEPGVKAIAAWEEREREAVAPTEPALAPPASGGRQPSPQRLGHHPAAGQRPSHAAHTRTEGGTSRSLLSAGSHAARAKRRTRFLAGAALGGLVGLTAIQGFALLARSRANPLAAPAVQRPVAEAPTADASGATAPPQRPVLPPPSAAAISSSAAPAHSSSAGPSPRQVLPGGERPAPSAVRSRNTMVDDL